jgi:secondary thiamine-phosphate synthase enzyme
VNRDLSDFKIHNSSYSFSTKGEVEFIDLSSKVQEEVRKSGVKNGIVHVFAPHATGILILTENDHALLEDIRRFLEKTIPKDGDYAHPSNAHSHLRSVLLPPDRTLPVVNGQVELGTWQSLLFVETDVHPRRRTVIIQVIGEQRMESRI